MRAGIDRDPERLHAALAAMGFFDPTDELIAAEAVQEHFEAAAGWYAFDREFTIDRDYVRQVMIDVSAPHSRFWELMRRQTMPAPDDVRAAHGGPHARGAGPARGNRELAPDRAGVAVRGPARRPRSGRRRPSSSAASARDAGGRHRGLTVGDAAVVRRQPLRHQHAQPCSASAAEVRSSSSAFWNTPPDSTTGVHAVVLRRLAARASPSPAATALWKRADTSRTGTPGGDVAHRRAQHRLARIELEPVSGMGTRRSPAGRRPPRARPPPGPRSSRACGGRTAPRPHRTAGPCWS